MIHESTCDSKLASLKPELCKFSNHVKDFLRHYTGKLVDVCSRIHAKIANFFKFLGTDYKFLSLDSEIFLAIKFMIQIQKTHYVRIN